MNIALDWGDTYTADPLLWRTFIAACALSIHNVYIVTSRHENAQDTLDPQQLPQGISGVIYTGGEAKSSYCARELYHIDVWIDDRPEYITRDHGGLLDWPTTPSAEGEG